ncbi:MAG: DUF5049 domain-containing protein [Sphaerochaetaceae bacterium]
MDNKIIEQILKVRDTSLTNMFDLKNVKFIAEELELLELVAYIEKRENEKEYINFILTGKQ